MERQLNIFRWLFALTLLVVIAAGTAPVMAGDSWLDSHGIRTDNVTLNGNHVTNVTYWQDPPFLSTKVPPNVLIVLDNSGSMNGAAYSTTFNPAQFASGHYYGYFEPDKMYRYATNGNWVVTTDDTSTATADNPIASGDFLNWAAMRRIEATKMLLVGGKQNPRSPGPNQTVKVTGETVSDSFHKDFKLYTTTRPTMYPFQNGYYRFTRNRDDLTVDPVQSNKNPLIPPVSNFAVPGTWAVVGAASAVEAIDDPPYDFATNTVLNSDGDTSYIENRTTATWALFNIADMPGAPFSPTGTITNVSVVVAAKRVYSGNSNRNATFNIQASIGVGTAASQLYYTSTTTGLQNNSNYYTYTFDWPVNPRNNNNPWTWDDIKGATSTPSAYQLLVFGPTIRTTPSANLYPRFSQVYVVITATLPSGGPYKIIIDTGRSKQSGIIDSLQSDVRFGLAFYNSGAGIEVGNTNGRGDGGYVKAYVDFDQPASMTTAIEGLVASTWTPLAETLHEMIRYFKQDTPAYANSPADYQTGQNYDPYYYQYSRLAGSGLADQYVPCAKSFILMLTDGEPTQDKNIPANLRDYNNDGLDPGSFVSNGTHYLDDVALWGRTTDLRTDLSGNQNVILYTVYMYGSGSPLLKLAAINGGFDDLNGDGKPGPDLKEYTRDSNSDGVLDSNDLPLTYFEGDDGYELQASIIDAITAILKRAASGTSVSVLGASWRGEGSIFQAYFYPERVEDLRRIKWTGFFRSLFVDRNGLIHEDTNGDRKLTPSDDRVVSFSFTAGQDTRAEFNWDRVDNSTGEPIPDGEPDSTTPVDSGVMSEAKPLWDAGKALALRDPADRAIYTSIDEPSLTPGVIAFDTPNAAALRPFIRGKTAADAENLIRFIRGEQLAGWRDRQLTVDNTLLTWKLGDIVFSDPVVVAGPKERFDKSHHDQSYADFYNRWQKRRAVVYVGGNDGMLHAFNNGFSIAGSDDPDSTASTTQVTFCEKLSADGTACVGDPTKPLGKELWTFIPYDVLPHLAWLADPDYAHVYYADLMPRVTDARIFTPDDTHVNGWGTILILGLRMGGGEIDVQDDFGSAAAGSELRSFKSAYCALDITNPDVPPAVLWRFTDDELGFTMATPSIVREEDGAGNDYWYAVIGSGPSNYRGGRVVANDIVNTKFTKSGQVAGLSGMSTASPYLFVIDLKTGRPRSTWTEHPTMSGTGKKGVIKLAIPGVNTYNEDNAFATSTFVTDYPLDFKYDVIYGGTTYCASGCAADGSGTWSGHLYRIRTKNDTNPGAWEKSLAHSPGRPITTQPNAALDTRANVWVYYGTGRFLHIDDRFDASTQAFYGLKDPCYFGNLGGITGCPAEITTGTTGLLNSNAYETLTTSEIYPTVPANTFPNQPRALVTFWDLQTYMTNAGKGWYIALGTRERITTNGFALGGIAGFGSYTPTDDVCEFEGTSKQYFPSYLTGTAYFYPQGTAAPTYTVAGRLAYAKSVVSGSGLPSAPAVHISKSGDAKMFIQQSTGAITVLPLETPLSVRSGLGMKSEATN